MVLVLLAPSAFIVSEHRWMEQSTFLKWRIMEALSLSRTENAQRRRKAVEHDTPQSICFPYIGQRKGYSEMREQKMA